MELTSVRPVLGMVTMVRPGLYLQEDHAGCTRNEDGARQELLLALFACVQLLRKVAGVQAHHHCQPLCILTS